MTAEYRLLTAYRLPPTAHCLLFLKFADHVFFPFQIPALPDIAIHLVHIGIVGCIYGKPGNAEEKIMDYSVCNHSFFLESFLRK